MTPLLSVKSSFLQLRCLTKDAVLLTAAKVLCPKQGAVVHAFRFFQLHTNPVPVSKAGLASVPDDSSMPLPHNLVACSQSCLCCGHATCGSLPRAVGRPRQRTACNSGRDFGGRVHVATQVTWLTKDSILHLCIEIRNTKDAPIMHAFRFIQLDPNPLASSKLHWPNILHHTRDTIPSHLAANFYGVCRLLQGAASGLHFCFARFWRPATLNKSGFLCKHTVLRFALEVLPAQDRPVMESLWLIQLQAQPLTCCEVHKPAVFHRCSEIVPQDFAPDSQRLLHCSGRSCTHVCILEIYGTWLA
mmetsp:Transcript_36017/g.66194  ORF Transcript_36017/g.66194 Transcript_36017/m.66194 type:complete len:302 (-) Transcript_36017:28-933(-)